MKKIRLLSLLLALALIISACGGAKKEKSGGEEKSEGAKDSYDVVYLTPSTASQFWTHVGIGIENAMKDMEKEHGIKINYSIVGPSEEGQTEEYVTAFEQAIAKKPDAIITATLAIDSTVPKAKEATDNGIVLNFVNCGLGIGDDGAHEETYNQFYYCSNKTIGEMAGEAFLKAKEAKNIGEGIVGVNTNVENEALDQRVIGFREYVKEHAPKLEQTDTYYNGNVVEKAQSNAENIISTYGDKLMGMFAGNNITGNGVALAVEGANLKDKIVTVAVDSDDTEIKALKDGVIDAIIVQNAYEQGYLGMKNAIETLINGKNPEEKKQVNCPPSIVDKDNMEDQKIKELLDPTLLKK